MIERIAGANVCGFTCLRAETTSCGASVPSLVESIKVPGGALDQLFDLTFGDMGAGVFADALQSRLLLTTC